ncbi:hypothetical protein ACIP02_22005 [Pseudomonas sp. NPDC089408]|uniref:hypothetical protein n=1 Tax=Pseudomonas sp. NPDC089408 TaxID=3364465 RepID=UPI0037F5F309
MTWAEAWKWISDNNGALAFLLALGVAGCGLYHYISIKRSEERGRRFSSYHELVEALNGDGKGGSPYIDRQITVVYEMRNFPEYYPVTLRLLKRSLERWRMRDRDAVYINRWLWKKPVNNSSLVQEAELTIKYIERIRSEKSYLLIPE